MEIVKKKKEEEAEIERDINQSNINDSNNVSDERSNSRFTTINNTSK